MSTDLYGIRIQEVKPNEQKVQVKVFVVYYDTEYKNHQPLPEDPSFFLRILWDRGDPRFFNSSIGREISLEQISSEEWVDNNTYRFIRRVDRLSTRNYPVNDYDLYADFYYEREGSWEDEEQLVQAIYEIQVSDEKYMDHLTVGMSWGTTSYETKAMIVAQKYVNVIPDINNPIIKMNPYGGEETEEGTIFNACFGDGGRKLFIINNVGELVCIDTNSWLELWRVSTEAYLANLINLEEQKVMWITEKKVYDYDGNNVAHRIAPKFKSKYEKATSILYSPKGSFYLFSEYSEKLALYTKNGYYLWEYVTDNKDILFPYFNYDEEHMIIREEGSGMINVIDLFTGARINKFRLEGTISSAKLHESGLYLSYDDLGSNMTKIYDIKNGEDIFEYTSTPQNKDYLSACFWSIDNRYSGIITTGNGTRNNMGYGGYITIYPSI